MAFPTFGTDGFGVGTATFGAITSASDQWLSPQPHDPDDESLRAPRLGRGDGGIVQDGLDGLILIFGRGERGTLSDAQFDAFVDKHAACAAQAYIGYVRYYKKASKAYATEKCIVHMPEKRRIGGTRYYEVTWKFTALGIA